MTTKIKSVQTGEAYIRRLMAKGRYTFTLEEATVALQVSKIAVRATLRRLKKKGFLATPARGFYVIIPPEYETIGCLPADQLIADLMSHFGEKYYIGLLSAAELFGAAHQKPQEFQVIVSHNRKMVTCGKVVIRFVARKDLNAVPTVQVKTRRGYAQVSTPEATTFDLMTYSEYAGGMSNVATVLSELCEKLDPNKLKEIALQAPNISSIQRVGYVFDRILEEERFANPLQKVVKKRAKAIIPLVASGSRKGVPIDYKWNLFINEKVEPDL